MHDFRIDVRQAWRSLMARPSFTATAVLTLGLGLGVTTAVTSVVYAVLVAPPPFSEPGRLVQIARIDDGRRGLQLPAADVAAIRESVTTLDAVGVAGFRDIALGGGTVPDRVRAVVVTPATLRMLGVAPSAGRLPDEADDTPGGACLAVLSHGVATARFGGLDDVVGSDVRIDGRPCTVTAVMPAGFAFPAPYYAPGEVWLLAGPSGTDWSATTGRGFLVFGRMAATGGIDAVRLELEAIGARLEIARADPTGVRFTAMGYAESIRSQSQRRLLTLLAAAGLVLVIACVNVVNLQLGRGAERHAELATRSALGASRGRLVRQLLTETTLLFVAAAVVGLVVAAWGVNLIVGLRSFYIPRMEEAGIDAATVLACLGTALLAAILGGLFPALRLAEAGARGPTVAARGRTTGPRWRRFQRAMMAIETTLVVVLSSAATMLALSYSRVTRIDPGFRAEGVLHARVTPPVGRYANEAALTAFHDRLQERLAALPGVHDVALADVPPGVGAGAEQPFAVAGQSAMAGAWPRAAWRTVSEGYFTTLEIPVLRGGFEGRGAEPHVVVVNEQFARRFFDGGDPIGQRLHLVSSPHADAPEERAWTIVGVVADAREEYTYREPPPSVYVRFSDRPALSAAILVRTSSPPLSLAPAVQAAVAEIDPDQPVYGLRALDFLVTSELDLNRLGMTLLGIFAIVALVLSIAGIHGVITQIVGQRLPEIGLRLALGADGRDVQRIVVGECARYAAVGVLAGIGLALLLTRRIESLTHGWTGMDARVLAATALIVTAAALLSAFLPARRAARMDPLVALRDG